MSIPVPDSGKGLGEVRIIMRNYLSSHHLYAARYAAEDSKAREATQADLRSFDIRNRGYVLTAVVESAAFLEATINEVFQDVIDGHPGYSSQIAPDCRAGMAALWKATDFGRRLDTLGKYDLALSLGSRGVFSAGERPYQDAALLVKLRNYVIHYSPHDAGRETEHKLAEPLRQRFPGSALMRGMGNAWFPDHALGAPCAEWSWRSARDLTDEFANRMNLKLNYQVADFGDALP